MFKAFIVSITIVFLDIQWGFLPKAWLLACMFFACGFDFVTGIMRAKLEHKPITNEKLLKQVKKCWQYGGALVINMFISFLSIKLKETGNDTWKYAPNVMAWANNGLLLFIIYVELRSSVGNLMAVDSDSPISTSLFKPTLKALTIRIKNNPIAKLFIETGDDAEVTVEEVEHDKPKT